MNPLETFFSFGNKVTGGNPVKKAQFDFYLYWILALAFFYLMVNNMYLFFTTNYQLKYLAWGLVMAVITWFNYHTLTAFYNGYTNLKRVSEGLNQDSQNKTDEKELEVESVDEMIKSFENKEK